MGDHICMSKGKKGIAHFLYKKINHASIQPNDKLISLIAGLVAPCILDPYDAQVKVSKNLYIITASGKGNRLN